MVRNALVILGSGYTARYVLHFAAGYYSKVFATSREPAKNLGHVTPSQRLLFDLSKQDSWKNVPDRADLLWCFPAAPLELVKQFAAAVTASARRIVVLGSTSAYEVGGSLEYPPPWIDETAPIDLAKPRVQGEEFLRSNCNAIILRVAGIYGPGRNPLDWIKRGRVGPSRKYVNLIHVEDLAMICLAALKQAKPGESYNVSDGTPRTWNEICAMAHLHWELTPPAASDHKEIGKRISNTKLTKELGYTIQRPDLYQELDSL